MKKIILFIFSLVFFSTSSFSQNLWKKTTNERLDKSIKMERVTYPRNYQLFSLNLNALKSQLALAPLDSSGQKSNIIIQFPNPDGGFENYAFYESPIMEKGLSDQFPDIKTYSAIGIDNPTARMRISFTQFGLHAMTVSGGLSTVYIDTYTKDLKNFIVYRKSDVTNTRVFECHFDEKSSKKVEATLKNTLPQQRLSDGIFRTYRFAVACTGEYAAFHGGTIAGAQAAIVTTVNRVNLVYERDFSVRLILVANNTSVLYTNPATDPFTNENANALIGESQTEITATIGSANFDIGHTVSTGGGGLAGLGVLCDNSQKAAGITGSPAPVGDPYDIDYVAHEVGHQFGCNHTFNNSCDGNRNSSTAVEPGSGSTVMAYAGICAPNVQLNSDDHFSFISIQEAQAVILGTSCASTLTNGNAAPVVNAGLNYTIPNGTAYILKGAATDANSDALTYCWEQTNSEVSTQAPTQTATSGPNYRSNIPSTSPDRYMPNLASVIANNLAPTWEVTPTVARTMNFALTVRDNRSPNGGQTGRDDMTVTTAAVGPFLVNSPSAMAISWVAGSNQTVTWTVAGTTANTINAAFVDILLSNDGGLTYPILLASKVPNDGSEQISVPNNTGNNKRIMIRGYKHIFYDISNNNFAITAAPSSFRVAFSGVEEQQNKEACQGTDVSYNISYDALGGFSAATTFTASGLPAGAVATFVPASMNASGTTVMTISNTIASPAGTYNVIVTGTSGANTKTASLYFVLFSSNFGVTTLSTPANNAINQLNNPTLTWVANPNATAYDVEVSTSNTFTPIVSSGTVTNTSYTATALNPNTDYFWRISPKNTTCGNAPFTNSFTFRTGAVACNTIASPNVPVAISGSGAPTVTSTINITSGGTISDVNVFTDITHEYTDDLRVTLTKGSTTVQLFTRQCGSNDNINATFDDSGVALACGTNPAISGTITPSQVLSAFNGQSSVGIWTLTVEDLFNADGGAINNWSLNICANALPLEVAENTFQDFAIYPNPSNGEFTIKFNSLTSEKVTINVHDIRGREMFQKSYDNLGAFSQNINLNTVEEGVYLVTISEGARKIVKRIVIQ